MSANVSAYCYVDSAFGSVTFRNNVRRVEMADGQGKDEAYASYQRATRDLWDYIRGHKNRKGKPSVEGFPGATWTPFLPLDFDAEGNPTRALGCLRVVVLCLDAWGVERRAMRCFFSGNKGFHLELPAALFGGFEPSVDLHKHLKRAAERIMGDIPFDESIYDKLRLWRLEGSKNRKGGLYKIRLTVDEVLSLGMPDILELARAPRSLESIPNFAAIADDDWLPVDELVSIWTEAQQQLEPVSRERQAAAVTDDSRDRLTVAAITAEWPYKPVADERVSRHTHYLMPLAGFLTGSTSAEHTTDLLKAAAQQAADQTFLHDRDWEAEIERLAEGSAARREKGEQFTGGPTLAERFPALAAVLGVLWASDGIDLWEAIKANEGQATGEPRAVPRRSARAELRRAMGLTVETTPTQSVRSVFNVEIPDYAPKPRPRPVVTEKPARAAQPHPLLLRPARAPTAHREQPSKDGEPASAAPLPRLCDDCNQPTESQHMRRCAPCRNRWGRTPGLEDLPM